MVNSFSGLCYAVLKQWFTTGSPPDATIPICSLSMLAGPDGNCSQWTFGDPQVENLCS